MTIQMPSGGLRSARPLEALGTPAHVHLPCEFPEFLMADPAHLQKPLGEGVHYRVFRARHRTTQDPWVVKIPFELFHQGCRPKSEASLSLKAHQEAACLRALQQIGHGPMAVSRGPIIASTLVEGPTLLSLIEAPEKLHQQYLDAMGQLILNCSQAGLVIGDANPGNIIFTEHQGRLTAVLIDGYLKQQDLDPPLALKGNQETFLQKLTPNIFMSNTLRSIKVHVIGGGHGKSTPSLNRQNLGDVQSIIGMVRGLEPEYMLPKPDLIGRTISV